MSQILFVFLILCSTIALVDGSSAHWSYEGEAGPENWGKEFPDCYGARQSPINIVTDKVQAAKSKGFLRVFSPNPVPNATETNFINNGHTVQLSLLNRRLFVAGSTFPTLVNTLQCHFHTPSEHTINGQSYPLELHIVNGDALRDETASKFPIAVFGILYEEGTTEDPFLNQLIPFLEHLTVEHGGETVETKAVNLTLIPNLNFGKEFYQYEGSLTTPPCYEVVHWSVSTTILSATNEQIAKFEHVMGENARPVQDLNGRTVTKRVLDNSFHMKCKDSGKVCPDNLTMEMEAICDADLCPNFFKNCCGTPINCMGKWYNGKCSSSTCIRRNVFKITKSARFGGAPCIAQNGEARTQKCPGCTVP